MISTVLKSCATNRFSKKKTPRNPHNSTDLAAATIDRKLS